MYIHIGFNPAVATGLHFQKLIDRAVQQDYAPKYIAYLPIYIVFPMIGAMIAGMLYNLTLDDATYAHLDEFTTGGDDNVELELSEKPNVRGST